MELSEVQDGIKEAESAAKVCSIRIKHSRKKNPVVLFQA
jgi:hypothetical protein